MKVIRAEVLGFCMGVRRAVETAWRESSARKSGVYTLGPLIHNPGVLSSLKERGVKILNEGEFPQKNENAAVIIRAHGISPRAENELARQNIRILDATCPHVKQSQKKAYHFAGKAYRIFLAGEKNHAEISGLLGYAEAALPPGAPSCFVVGNPLEAEEAAETLFRREPGAKTVLIGQTTISGGEYQAIGEKIRNFFPDLETVNTICGATAERQEALRKLCEKVDAVIIAGGKESANTRRLLFLACELKKPAWLAETPADIPPEIKAYKTVGLSAGASTPDTLIAEIEETLAGL